MPATVRVLTIDGGGIRGIIPARVLVELERLAARPIAELFDLVVGTSTGGILALGLTRPDGPGQTASSAEDLLDLYRVHGRRIFPGGGPPTREERIWGPLGFRGMIKDPGLALGQPAQRASALFGGNPRFAGNARYLPDGLTSVLTEYFGNARLGEALVDVVVTAYDMRTRHPILFRRSDARHDPARNPLMLEVARATSAAPTYFPPEQLEWGSDDRILIDGGVFANNPAMIGYVEGLTLSEAKETGRPDVLVVSLGTGTPEQPVTKDVTYDAVASKNWLAVARDVLEVVFDGQSDSQHELLGRLAAHAGLGLQYWRFQTVLRGVSVQLDNAHPENLAALSRLAEQLVAERRTDLAALGERLLT